MKRGRVKSNEESRDAPQQLYERWFWDKRKPEFGARRATETKGYILEWRTGTGRAKWG